MAKTVKKAAAKTKAAADQLSAAVASARTRKGKPKVTKPPPTKKKTAPPPPKPTGKLLDAFIAHETGLRDAIAFPDDTGDAMFTAIEAYLYYKERITKAQLVKQDLEG